jgi:[ribosomal protein S18]-alanine N-acetyltransferase
VIRALTLADLPEMIAIEQASHSHPWSAAQCAEGFTANYFQLAAVTERGLVGFASLLPVLDEVELLNIAVDPVARGQGHAKALLTAAAAELKSRAQLMHCEVRASNASARGLYESLGFKVSGLRKNYYPIQQAGREHAVLYQWRLT